MKFSTGANSRHPAAASGTPPEPAFKQIPTKITLVTPLKIKVPQRAQRDFSRTLFKNGEMTISSEKPRKQAQIILM